MMMYLKLNEENLNNEFFKNEHAESKKKKISIIAIVHSKKTL